MTRSVRRIFPAGKFPRHSIWLWSLTVAVFLWFDTSWCAATTFSAMSMPETWVNALLAATLLAAPSLAAGKSKLQAAVITISAIWLEANLLYSRTYFNAIPLSSYMLVGNLSDFTASITDSFRWLDTGFAVITAAAWIIAARRHPDCHPDSYPRRWAACCGILALLSVALICWRGGYRKAWQSLENANYYSCRVPMYTVAGWLIYDAGTTLEPLSDADRAMVEHWIDSTPPIPPVPAQSGQRTSLILVMCESLESWPIGLSLEGKEITPVLNRLVADTLTTLYAPKILTQVGAGRSIDGQLLINTGLQPMLSGVYAMSHIDGTYPSLAKAMNPDCSYILTVDKPVTWNQAGVARAFGIDTIVSRDCWENDEKVGSRKKLGDRSFMRQAAAKMARGEIWPQGNARSCK